MQPKFVNVAGLYEHTSTTGRTVYAGTWGATRVYLMPTGLATGPTYWLAVRAEDYDVKRHGPRVESRQDATDGLHGAFGARDVR